MKLSKLPQRTRRRIWKLASNHLLDVEQVIGIAVDVLWSALEGGAPVVMPKPSTPSVVSNDQPQAIGDLINAAIERPGHTHPHRNRKGR